MSDFFKLNFFDLFKAALVAGLAVVLQGLLVVFEGGALPDGPMLLGFLKAGGIAAGAYLIKQLFTSSTGALAPEKPVE
jgi:hypothetical protein